MVSGSHASKRSSFGKEKKSSTKIPSNHIWNALEVAASSLDWEAIFPDILAVRDYAFLLYFMCHTDVRTLLRVFSNKRNFNFLLTLAAQWMFLMIGLKSIMCAASIILQKFYEFFQNHGEHSKTLLENFLLTSTTDAIVRPHDFQKKM